LVLSAAVCWALYGVNIFLLGPSLILFTIPLIVFGLTIGFLSSSLIIYKGQSFQTAAWAASWLFTPFCAAYCPVQTFPIWMQKISYCLPPTYIFEAMRTFVFTGTMHVKFIIIGIALHVAYFAAALCLFLFAFEKSRQKGLSRLE